MAILVKFSVSGMPVDKYETVLRRLEAAGQGAPPGRLQHISYGDREGLQVIDVYESREALERFAGTLVPILGELGVRAEAEVFDAYKLIRA
jgi:hypothetical protein